MNQFRYIVQTSKNDIKDLSNTITFMIIHSDRSLIRTVLFNRPFEQYSNLEYTETLYIHLYERLTRN